MSALLTVRAEHLDTLMDRFRDMGDAVRSSLRDAAATLGTMAVGYVRDDKLSGQVLKSRSGALKDSIYAQPGEDGDSVFVELGSRGVPYAAIQEYGGTIPAHVIEAKDGKLLACEVDGVMRFYKRINFPGATLPARSYLASSVDDLQGDIIDAFSAAVAEGVGS